MISILQAVANTFQQALILSFHFLTANYFLQAKSQTLSTQAMQHIVILGGSYTGISTAHRLLKQTDKIGPIKITLVSPNTHFYWNMASPRGLVPGQITDERLFQPIVAGFKQYPTTQFDFILGSAESLDTNAKEVSISGDRKLKYDFLILATGSRTRGDTPFKGLGSTEETKATLHDFQDRVKGANTIVVAGGGVTGVEVAGDLAYEYGMEKKIILVSFQIYPHIWC